VTKAAPVAAYVRVSSASQSHEMQVQAIERAARARGDAFPTAWYRDTMSGGKMKRPALEQLRADVREGKVTRLYLYRLDRLTRSGMRDMLSLVEELEAGGCELVTVADAFDLRPGAARDIVIAVLAMGAQLEREALAERIKSARAKVEAKGGAWGRPGRMTLSQLDRAWRMAAQGRSVRAIAVALKVPKSIVGRALATERSARRPEKVAPKLARAKPKKKPLAKA